MVTDPKMRERLRESYDRDWFVEAPVILVACADPREAKPRWDREGYWKVDVAIAMQNMVLMATEEGLGTCWIAAFNEDVAKSILGIPSDIRVVAMTPLGYPDEEKGEVADRKPADEIVHFDRW